jgi:hypothetical protein
MANGNGIPTAAVAQPTGIVTNLMNWIFHPSFADSDPWDWAAFVVLFVMAGLLWSKVVKQTLDAAI